MKLMAASLSRLLTPATGLVLGAWIPQRLRLTVEVRGASPGRRDTMGTPIRSARPAKTNESA